MSSDKHIAIFGYTMAGGTIGYCFGRTNNNVGEVTVIGLLLGLSTGLVSQYRITSTVTTLKNDDGTETTIKQGAHENTPMWKSVLSGAVLGKASVPIMIVGGIVLMGLARR